jgi:hypothetical protein
MHTNDYIIDLQRPRRLRSKAECAVNAHQLKTLRRLRSKAECQTGTMQTKATAGKQGWIDNRHTQVLCRQKPSLAIKVGSTIVTPESHADKSHRWQARLDRQSSHPSPMQTKAVTGKQGWIDNRHTRIPCRQKPSLASKVASMVPDRHHANKSHRWQARLDRQSSHPSPLQTKAITDSSRRCRK